MSEPKEKEQWTIDRHVPLSLIVTIIIGVAGQTAAGIWYAAQISTRVDSIERQLATSVTNSAWSSSRRGLISSRNRSARSKASCGTSTGSREQMKHVHHHIHHRLYTDGRERPDADCPSQGEAPRWAIDLSDKLSLLITKVDGIMNELDDLKTNMATLTANVAAIIGDIGTMKSQAADLTAKLAAAVSAGAAGTGIDPAAVEQAAQDAKALSDGLAAAHASLAAAPTAPAAS
jgi:hypothetical protein